MRPTPHPPYLDILKNQIDITHVPFSDRGSRLLVYQTPGMSSLYVLLAERLIDIDPDFEAYINRPPYISDLCFVDHQGSPLAFDVTTYPHLLIFSTSCGDFKVVFQDERNLAIELPQQTVSGIKFHVSSLYWEPELYGGNSKSIRGLVYRSNGEIARDKITPVEGGHVVEFIVRNDGNHTISLAIGESSSPQEVVPFSIAYESAKARWDEWFNRIPPVSEEYERTYAYAWWIMGNNLISPAGKIAYEAMVPSKKRYVGIWLWDCAMHALAYRHVDPELARDQIRAMIACQLPNGMIPDAIFDEGVVTEIDHPIRGKVTKPPILAWAALKIHKMAPDNSFLEEIYDPLLRWNDWWFSMNDDDVDGLVQYNHPYSSGLDNNPLWDYGMPVESPDINTYLCIQMKSLAEMADILGMETEGAAWRKRAAGIVERMMDKFWDEDAGVFQALYDGQPIPVLTPFNLIPLWTGELSHSVMARLVSHLTNPDEFWGEYPLPTVARNDPHYNPEAMWRGPVWANVNYFFIEALNQIGDGKLADELRDKTLKLIKTHRSIYEYYNAETGEPPESAVGAFGWSAAVFIDLAIQASREKT